MDITNPKDPFNGYAPALRDIINAERMSDRRDMRVVGQQTAPRFNTPTSTKNEIPSVNINRFKELLSKPTIKHENSQRQYGSNVDTQTKPNTANSNNGIDDDFISNLINGTSKQESTSTQNIAGSDANRPNDISDVVERFKQRAVERGIDPNQAVQFRDQMNDDHYLDLMSRNLTPKADNVESQSNPSNIIGDTHDYGESISQMSNEGSVVVGSSKVELNPMGINPNEFKM